LIGESLSRLASAAARPILAIGPMRLAIERFAPTPGHLTGLHKHFLKECLLSKHYKDALPILSNPITEVQPQQCAISVFDHLAYHYYGGMVYIGLKKYNDALDFFSLVISAPANVSSQVQIEAYKKFVLVSLLVKGRIEQLPKYTSLVVLRACKNLCMGYTEFAAAWESLNFIRVRNEFNKVAEGFNKDKNLGLAKQCIQALYRRQIQQLTQTYLTLSLADIAKSIGIDGPEGARTVEAYIVKMIEDGEIHATIAHAHPSDGGMVSFHDNPDRYNTGDTLAKLDTRIEATIRTSERVIALERAVGSSKEFLNKAVGFSGGGSGGFGTFSGSGFPTDGEDFGYDGGLMEDRYLS
jgi:COP9 signalosome complex subunit 3